MSNVPQSKREKHDFLATHQLLEVRRAVTELAINDFGYDKKRFEERIAKYEKNMPDNDRKAELIARWREKNKSFYSDFVEEETKETRDILRRAVHAFEIGNSIFPSGDTLIMEFNQRRKYLDLSIGYMYCLIQELQYIAETLPGDKNRYEYLTGEIKKAIELMKGVRRSANRFLKNKKENK